MALAGFTLGVLVVMTVISLVTGASQEAFEHVALPNVYAHEILQHADALRAVFALDAAEKGIAPSATEIVVQAVISSTKFSVSYLSLVLFGIAIPRDTRLGWVL